MRSGAGTHSRWAERRDSARARFPRAARSSAGRRARRHAEPKPGSSLARHAPIQAWQVPGGVTRRG